MAAQSQEDNRFMAMELKNIQALTGSIKSSVADINSAHHADSGRQPFLMHHAPLSVTSGRLEQQVRN